MREFLLKTGRGEADYLLFVDGSPVGVVEAKREGSTLTDVELQSTKYSEISRTPEGSTWASARKPSYLISRANRDWKMALSSLPYRIFKKRVIGIAAFVPSVESGTVGLSQRYALLKAQR